jgi:hypothetical protein
MSTEKIYIPLLQTVPPTSPFGCKTENKTISSAVTITFEFYLHSCRKLHVTASHNINKSCTWTLYKEVH